MTRLINSLPQIFVFLFLLTIFAEQAFSAGSTVNFYGAKAYGNGGSYYYGMEGIDFDGDGNTDVLTASYNNILVFYGDGKGGFAAPPVTAFSTVGGEIFPISGDFNGDGRGDIVFPLRNPANNEPSIAVLLGESSRTFSQPIFSGHNPSPGEMVSVDFDNDGKLDLLGVPGGYSANNSIVFYKGDGAGGFAVGGKLDSANQLSRIQKGDFNNDGLIDLLYSDSEGKKIVKNLGGGSFGTPAVLPSSDYPINSTQIADVNNDGKQDIVAVEQYSVDPYITVWLGKEDFTFSELPDFTVSTREQIRLHEIADVDNDRNKDLIFSAQNRILVSRGSGDGKFSEPDSYVDGGGGSLIVRDLNADGWLDIVSTQAVEFAVQGSGSFVVLLNQAGVFRSAPALETGDETKDIAVGDINGDGLNDFVIVNRGGGGGPGDVIILTQTNATVGFKNDRGWQNEVLSGGNSGLDPYSVVIGDFNQDNKKDIVVAGHGAFGAAQNALIIMNQGNNNFVPTLFQIGTGDIYSVGAADFNSDGKLDLLTTGYEGVSVSMGIGNGTFSSPVRYFTDVPSSQFAIGDFNSDGKSDVAVVNYTTNKIGILLNNGSGAFSTANTPGFSGGVSAVAAADMNKDEKLDLVIAKPNGVSIMIGIGNGSFNSETAYQITAVSATDLAVADFDGDAMPDVAVTSGTNSITILLNDGTGRLGRASMWGGGAVLAAIAAGDLNNDKKTDLIFGFSLSQTGYTKILFNLTEDRPIAQNKTLYDFDGDGRSDISVYRPSDGAWHLLQSTSGYTGFQFGITADKLVPADYDGDGKTDAAVYRDGTWHILQSNAGYIGFSFGMATDIPVPADYDGDGKADPAVFRDGTWHILQSGSGYLGIQFGISSDKPVPADYDGDGRTDIAVFRDGVWHILGSQTGYSGFSFGAPTDKPVPSDYDGDGRADPAVYREGVWHVLQSQKGYTGFQFGLATDLPVPADYDGDGKTDAAVFREGTWHILNSSSGYTGAVFGNPTDKPVQNSSVSR